MAFDYTNLYPDTSGNGGYTKSWNYTTVVDNVAACSASGYFNKVASRLGIGDNIVVAQVDAFDTKNRTTLLDFGTLFVTAISGGVVTTSNEIAAFPTKSYVDSADALKANLAGGNSFTGNQALSGTFGITNATTSISPTTGALTVAGGVGVAGNITTAKTLNLDVDGSTTTAINFTDIGAGGVSNLMGLRVGTGSLDAFMVMFGSVGAVLYGSMSTGTVTVPNALAVGKSILSSGPTSGVGYSTGAGGIVTQATSKATGVTLNTASGAITLNATALAAATIVSFVLTDAAIAATDVLILNHISGGTPGSYSLNARAAAGTATIDVRNNTAGSLSEAIVIQFALIKGVNA